MRASQIHDWLGLWNDEINARAVMLDELDRLIGDGDHGTNMRRGLSAVVALDPKQSATAGEHLRQCAMMLIRHVGGAAGPLYGTFFLRASAVLGADVADVHDQWSRALRAGVGGVAERGHCQVGDKTLYDVLSPATEAFAAADSDAWAQAALVADRARLETADMVASKGRAAFLGERSLGVIDPGATSASWLVSAGDEVFGA